MQLAGNRSLADYNMKQGPTLSNGKQQLAYLYKQLNEQNERFEKNKRNLGMYMMVVIWHSFLNYCINFFFALFLESLSSQYNADTIMALLQTLVAESEESSEVFWKAICYNI